VRGHFFPSAASKNDSELYEIWKTVIYSSVCSRITGSEDHVGLHFYCNLYRNQSIKLTGRFFSYNPITLIILMRSIISVVPFLANIDKISSHHWCSRLCKREINLWSFLCRAGLWCMYYAIIVCIDSFIAVWLPIARVYTCAKVQCYFLLSLLREGHLRKYGNRINTHVSCVKS